MILFLFLAPDHGNIFFYVSTLPSHWHVKSIISSYFFYLVLRRYFSASHEFPGQSGQKNLIQIYSFCFQLMPLACAHWFSIFAANRPMGSALVIFAIITCYILSFCPFCSFIVFLALNNLGLYVAIIIIIIAIILLFCNSFNFW